MYCLRGWSQMIDNIHVFYGSKKGFENFVSSEISSYDETIPFMELIHQFRTNESSGRESNLDSHITVDNCIVRAEDYGSVLEHVLSNFVNIVSLTHDIGTLFVHNPPQKVIRSLVSSYADIIEYHYSEYKKITRDTLKEIYLNLNRDILGQDACKKDIISGLYKLTANATEKPVVLMLYGPSGVGKTETAKSISRTLGGELLRIQFSMMQTNEAFNYVFEAVLVWKFDRFARNMRDALNNEHILSENGVKVISATELIPEGSIGIIVKAVLLGINEYYSADLSEKSQRGSKDNAEKCLYNGGTVPFGFKIVDKHYMVDDEKAKWVEKIFTMYANGKRISEICEYMNAMGVKSSTGAKFNKNSLHKMLENEKYIGTYIYDDIKIPNGIPRIISDELFERVRKTKTPPGRKPKNDEERYILSGKLFCGNCKEKYNKDVKLIGHSAYSRRKYSYYKCSNEKNCNMNLVPKEYIEEFVLQKCRSILTDRNISSIAKKIYAIAQKDNANLNLKNLIKELRNRENAKNNIIESLTLCEDDTVRQELFEKVKQLTGEIEGLNTEIAKERTKTIGIDEQEIKFFLKQFRDYDILNVAHRKALIDMLVNKIYLYDDPDGGEETNNYRITIILNAGKNTAEITDKLYTDIRDNTLNNGVCLMDNSGHQT